MSSVTVDLSPGAELVLRERARQRNQTLEAWIETLVEREAEGGLTFLEQEVRRITTRTPEQVLADRAEVLKTARRGLPIPEGKTLNDMVEGKWPGDETDEQIRVALEDLS